VSISGVATASLQEGCGCTRNGEPVKLLCVGLWAVIWPLELSDISAFIGTGSGVSKSGSRTAGRLDLAATTRRMSFRKGLIQCCESYVYLIQIVPGR